MIETGLVLCALLLAATVGWLGPWVPLTGWLAAALVFAGPGLLLGVPAGLWYHLRLRACLAPRNALPPRWWLHPVALHDRLAPDERPSVLRWFAAGGVGFGLTAIGCALGVLGVGLEALGRGAAPY